VVEYKCQERRREKGSDGGKGLYREQTKLLFGSSLHNRGEEKRGEKGVPCGLVRKKELLRKTKRVENYLLMNTKSDARKKRSERRRSPAQTAGERNG